MLEHGFSDLFLKKGSISMQEVAIHSSANSDHGIGSSRTNLIAVDGGRTLLYFYIEDTDRLHSPWASCSMCHSMLQKLLVALYFQAVCKPHGER